MSTTWTLCLTSTSNNTRKIVKVNPDSDTVGDLFRMAGEAFGINVQSLKTGFPPAPLDSNDTTKLSESKNVSNQERVQVVLEEKYSTKGSSNKKAAAKGKGSKKKGNSKQEDPFETPTSEIAATGRRTSKRAAAQAASESFSEVIKAQDRLTKEQNQPKKKAKRTAGTALKPNNNTASSESPAASKNKLKPAKKSAFASQPPGRRLGDGALVSSPGGAAAGRIGRSSKCNMRGSGTAGPKTPALAAGRQKYEDISVALMGTLNDSGKMGRILRKGLSNAVQNSYESTKAVTRLAALESHNPKAIQMERVQDNAKLQVKFAKGAQGRGYYEELVDWIPVDVLKEVITAIYKTDQEALRPHNLAFLSPRVLWALAYEHRYGNGDTTGDDTNNPSTPYRSFSVEDGYRNLLPNLEWSFLHRRKQTLSAKAQENLRQEEERMGADTTDYAKAAEAIHEVEYAMEHLQQYDRSQRSGRMAKAALARQQRGDAAVQDDSWTLTTPTDTDEDELLECVSTNTELSRKCNVSNLVKGLIEWTNIHNWRELANSEAKLIHSEIRKHQKESQLSLEQVEGWIDHAQYQSSQEIIVEICDGNPDKVDLLIEKARTGTPKDLDAWRAMPDVLQEELGDDSVSVDDVSRWCARAHRAMQDFEWLYWYATPVE